MARSPHPTPCRPRAVADHPPHRFHPWFRAKVQAALTETWLMSIRPIQPLSPAAIVSQLLADELGAGAVRAPIIVDYCAGGGGPIPMIERYINGGGGAEAQAVPGPVSNGKTAAPEDGRRQQQQPVHFVLTDLHPHIPNWALSAAASPNVHYAPRPVDAANSPPDLLETVEPPLPASIVSGGGGDASAPPPRVFRTFHLAFHHFPDDLAARILHNALSDTSSGFAIIELQDRYFTSILSVMLLGLGVMVFAPVFAWRWRSPGTLFWTWVVPVLPFVLVWDGWMSSVRTRTVDEVQDLMRACGADEQELKKWNVRSGRRTHLPPWADVNWIIATRSGD